MSEIVRTDTLFGSKKNIIGSTSADLVLETLGKVYIKTGRSTKTLTEILSQYSKEGKSETSEVTTEQIQNLLSEEYISGLVNTILQKNKKFGDFVSVDDLKSVGNQNLPVYFDSKSLPQIITGLSVPNKIETEDTVRGERGVSTAGVCDLTIIGGYNYGLNPADLEEYHFTNPTQVEAIIQRLLDEEVRNTYKPLQTPIVDTLIGSNVKTISSLTQDIYGVINATFVDIPDAASDQKGFINTIAQSFSGAKTFLTSITSPEVNTPLIKTQSQLTIQTNNANRANFYSEGLSVNGGVSANGLTDLTIIGGYNYGLTNEDIQAYGFITAAAAESLATLIVTSELSGYKPLQSSIQIGNNGNSTPSALKTLLSISQNAYGVIENLTFADIPMAGEYQAGLVSTTQQTFFGEKTFISDVRMYDTLTVDYYITTPNVRTQTINSSTALRIDVNNVNKANFVPEGLNINGGLSANGVIDLTIIGGYSIDPSLLNALGTFRGTYESVNDLPDNTMISSLDVNDYAFIIEEVSGDPEYARYKYDGSSWVKEYVLNNSAFTDIQWATINSGLTSTGKNTITTLGTITTGTWTASAIADDYISSASTWNNAASAISTVSGYFDSNNKVREGNLDATAIINALGTNAVNRAVADQNGLTINTGYLKLTGGRIKGNGTAYPLEICSSSASLTKSGIKYYTGGSNVTLLGYIGVDSSVGAFYQDSVGNFNTIWHSNNSNKSNVDWQCKILTVNNTANLNGGENHIGASGQNDIFLGRTDGANYIHIPTTGNSSETAALVITRGSSSNPLFTIHTDNSVYITRSLVVSQNIRATGGIAAGGIADLTIAYSSSVIQSLQAQIDALQSQINNLN